VAALGGTAACLVAGFILVVERVANAQEQLQARLGWAGAAATMDGKWGIGGLAASLPSGDAVMQLIRSFQVFVLSASTSAAISDTYASLALSLQWFSFQWDLGVASLPLGGSNLEALPAERAAQASGRRLAAVTSEATSAIAKLRRSTLTASQRMFAVALCWAVLIVAHAALLKLWAWWARRRAGDERGKRRGLPQALAYPRLEMKLAELSLIPVAEAVGILLASESLRSAPAHRLPAPYAARFPPPSFAHPAPHHTPKPSHRTGSTYQSWNGVIAGAGLLYLTAYAVLVAIVLRTLHAGGDSAPMAGAYGLAPKPQKYDEKGRYILFWPLAGRLHGLWGGARAGARAEVEPERSALLASTGLSVRHLAKLLRDSKGGDSAAASPPAAALEDKGGASPRAAWAADSPAAPGPAAESVLDLLGGAPASGDAQNIGALSGADGKDAVADKKGRGTGGKGGSETPVESAAGEEGGPPPTYAGSTLELQERFGSLFEKYKGDRTRAATFHAIDVSIRISGALFIGVLSASAAVGAAPLSVGMNAMLAVVQLSFALAVTGAAPWADVFVGRFDVATQWLASGSVVAVTVLTNTRDEGLSTAQTAMATAAVVTQALATYFFIICAILLLIRVRPRRAGPRTCLCRPAVVGCRRLSPLFSGRSPFPFHPCRPPHSSRSGYARWRSWRRSGRRRPTSSTFPGSRAPRRRQSSTPTTLTTRAAATARRREATRRRPAAAAVPAASPAARARAAAARGPAVRGRTTARAAGGGGAPPPAHSGSSGSSSSRRRRSAGSVAACLAAWRPPPSRQRTRLSCRGRIG